MIINKEKYSKYKNGYTILKKYLVNGGAVGEIGIDNINAVKTDNDVPEAIKNYVKMITIPDTDVVRVGSSMLKIQPYFSDIDVMNIIHKKINSNELVLFFITSLKKLLQNVLATSGVFFSDFKAGGLHWEAEQIMEEKHGNVTLYDACFKKGVIKLDIIGPYNERYLEMSTFFLLQSDNEYINIEADYYKSFQKSLLEDIAKYKESKIFKAVKRLWSLARTKNDLVTLNILQTLIKSNIALISQINADIETIILLLEHKNKYDVNFVVNELDGFKEKLSSILDVKLDHEKINLMLDIIKLLFIFKNNSTNNLIERLTTLHDYLLNVMNTETKDYLDKIKFVFPVSNVIPSVVITMQPEYPDIE